MLMLLLKILHNFSKWHSSSTFPFSNASSSSTFSSTPGLRLSPRSILLMRLPLQFLFGLLSLSYLSSIQLGVGQQYPALLSYCRWTALFPFCFSHTLFCSGLWRITFFFTVFLFCAGIANLEPGVSPSRTDTLFPSVELMFRDDASLCCLLLSGRDSPDSWGLSPTSAAFAVSCGLHQCVWTLMTVRPDPIPGTAASSEALQDVDPRLSQGEVFSLKDCYFFNRLLATDLFKLSVTSWFNFGYKCKFTHFF